MTLLSQLKVGEKSTNKTQFSSEQENMQPGLKFKVLAGKVFSCLTFEMTRK